MSKHRADVEVRTDPTSGGGKRSMIPMRTVLHWFNTCSEPTGRDALAMDVQDVDCRRCLEELARVEGPPSH